MSEDTPPASDAQNNYVLVVDSHGDVDILQVSYDTKWKDLRVMLQVKFDYEDLPVFTYTDDEEDIICLDSQESLDEALKVSKKNADVLHIQMRRCGVPLPQMQRLHSNQEENRRPTKLTKDHIEMARAAMGNTIGWAANAVKSAFSRSPSNISSDSITENACKREPVACPEISMDSLHVQETEPEPVLHEVGPSFQTNVKEVMDSSYDISVSTTGIYDSDEESELIVKEPIQSTSESQVDPEMLETIKEEVRSAITKELRTLREEVNVMTQSFTTKPTVESEVPCTSRDTLEGPRSPAVIKADIKKLKQEMKEARLYRKLKKQNEKTLSKKRLSEEIDVASSHLTPDGHSKKVRKYAASFICENLLDGSCVGVGQQFVKYWVFKNEGTIAWDHQIELRLIEESLTDDSSSVDPQSDDEEPVVRCPPMGEGWGPEKVSIGMPIVESGSTAVIAVSHLSPSVPCVYTSAWRLCHDGKFFGPRIWCKVAVKSGIDITPQTSDESLSGQSYVSQTFVPSRKISTEEQINAEDDLSNMLSFEMTAVGDFNKETANMEQSNNYNYTVSHPQQNTQLLSEVASEITEEEVKAAQVDPEPATTPEDEKEEEEPTIASLPEETVEERDASVVLEEQVMETRDEYDEEEMEEEFQDVEEEHSALNLDDSHSDVPSDFEVIPLPECFDTTKPLSPTEKAIEDAESIRCHLSGLTTGEQEDKVEKFDSFPPPPPVENQEEMEDTKEDSNIDEPEKDEEVLQDQHPEPELFDAPPAASSSQDKSVAPACLPVPQSVLDQDKPAPVSMVQDYATGYATPVQMPAPHQEPWVPQPIPLPRGVAEADKIWTKNGQDCGNPPSPQPRTSTSATAGGDNDVPLQTARTYTPSVNVSEEIDSPQICFPPDPDVEDADEFTLAPEPETPIDSPNTHILVPPGYPVSPPSIPSLMVPPTPPMNRSLENYTPSSMEQLVDMGFLDIDLNEKLIREFQGDMPKVVHALLHPRPVVPSRHHRQDRHGHGGFFA